MVIFNSFLNFLNAAVGRKQDFEDLVKSGDISRVMEKMESRTEETLDALKDYDPHKHDINKRADKVILDKDGNFKRTIKRWKLPISYPIFINEIAVVFIYGQPVKWGQTSDGTDNAFQAFTSLLRKIHFDAKVRQCKRLAGAETQAAMLFRVFRNDEGKADCQVRVLAASKGDAIYSRWDQYENLIAVGWRYYLQEGDTTAEHFELYTPETIYHCTRGLTGWEITPETNLVGKIPVILFQQEKEWSGVEPLIYREEYIASHTADVNDYFSDPMLILDADIVMNMPDKQDENKTLIKKNGTDSNAAAAYLTWDSAPESKKQELDWLQNHILSKTFTPNIDFENMKSLSNVTGKALKQMTVLASIKADKRKETHDELLGRVANLCKAIIGNVLDVSLKAECEKLEVTHEFTEPFGEDITDVIQTLTTAKDSGIISTESAVEQNPLVKDPIRELERLDEDDEKGRQTQRDLFDQYRRQGVGEEEPEEDSAE